MNKRLIIILLMAFVQSLTAQTDVFNTLVKEGDNHFKANNFIKAFELFIKAKEKAINSVQSNTAEARAEQSRKAIIQQQADLQKALTNAETSLKKADEMQLKMETAIFDKAIKIQFADWEGYNNYYWQVREYLGYTALDDNTVRAFEILSLVDTLDLRDNALLRVPKEVAECPNLKHLNLFGNPNINWQKSVETLEKLNPKTGIYVGIADLGIIPQKYWQLITGIKLFKTRLNEIPANILNQKQLVYLNIIDFESRNNFRTLPPELFDLVNLQNLYLDYAHIEIIPVEIQKLKNLRTLSLEGNNITRLPEEIGNLHNLLTLNLSNNKINELPMEIGELAVLEDLIISSNIIKELPKEIGNLQNLKVLDLIGNELTTLPQEIGELKNLEELSLNGNKIAELPMEIGKLKSLTNLDYRGNNVSKLPVEIGNLQNLKHLDVSLNDLTDLPAEIGNLINLDYFRLTRNQLTKLPIEFWKLENLTFLCISENKLTELHPGIRNLGKLRGLYLWENKIHELPAEIGALRNLKRFNLEKNLITGMPMEIGGLQNLKYFNVKYNMLTSLPIEIGKLHSLEELQLWGNDLVELPKEIGNLNKLHELSIGSNQLTTLPKEIGNLNLINFDFMPNPYSKMPEEIFKLKINFIGEKFRDLGLQLLNANNYSNALQSFLKAGDDESITCIYIGICHRMMGDSVKCTNYLNKAYSIARKEMENSTYIGNREDYSYCCLFVKKPLEANEAAKKILENNPGRESTIAKLAISYLLADQFDNAEKIFLEWKGKRINWLNKSWNELFLADIELLEKAGITHPDFQKVRDILNN